MVEKNKIKNKEKKDKEKKGWKSYSCTKAF